MNVTPEENALQEAALRANSPNEKEAQNQIFARQHARRRGSGMIPSQAPTTEPEPTLPEAN